MVSLRWHDPDQVRRSKANTFLSARFTGLPWWHESNPCRAGSLDRGSTGEGYFLSALMSPDSALPLTQMNGMATAMSEMRFGSNRRPSSVLM